MNRITLPLILLALWLILGTIFLGKWFCGNQTATVPAPVEKIKDATRLIIHDAGTFKTSAAGHFDFNSSSLKYLTPLSADVNTSIEQTAAYLKAHPDRALTITGLYKADEKNNSVFETLGLARANEVKKAFVANGVNAKQLVVTDRLLPDDVALKNGVLMDGVSFHFTETTKDDSERLAAIKARYEANPITIYFATGENNVVLTNEQRKAFSDLVYYLDSTPGSSLEVGGHTDNTGDSKTNNRLSRKRAEFVQDFLTGNGLDSDRMTAQGFGSAKPIATNSTSEGRAKNRRVEVRLK